jgi:hypothetical protein
MKILAVMRPRVFSRSLLILGRLMAARSLLLIRWLLRRNSKLLLRLAFSVLILGLGDSIGIRAEKILQHLGQG